MKKKKEMIDTLGLDPEPRKRKSGKRRILRILILIFVFVLLTVVAILPLEEKPSVQYQTATVKRGEITIAINATGNLAPTNKVHVGCELSGIVKTVAVDFNDRVHIGQPLASLDDTKFKAAVMESSAALNSAEANYLQARASSALKLQNVKRLRRLYRISAGKLPTPKDLEVAEAEMQGAKAAENAAKAVIRQARARLKIDETNLSKTVIVSPIDGVVLGRNVDPGQTVAASLQAPVLFSLARDLTQMELQVDVDEADIGLVREGQDAEFTVEAYSDRVFAARIAQIRYNPRITNGVVTYTSLLNVQNPDLVLRPGMTATVRIVAQKISDTLRVPNAALRYTPPQKTEVSANWRRLLNRFIRLSKADDPSAETQRWKIGYARVWCLRQGQLTPVSVRTGMTDGLYTEILEGDLDPGMQVAVETIGAE
jgi:HlyD family secretion protein